MCTDVSEKPSLKDIQGDPGGNVNILVGHNIGHSKQKCVYVRGSAEKSLARPSTRCHKTESIMSLERGVCSCAELQVFSCYRG